MRISLVVLTLMSPKPIYIELVHISDSRQNFEIILLPTNASVNTRLAYRDGLSNQRVTGFGYRSINQVMDTGNPALLERNRLGSRHVHIEISAVLHG